MKQIIKDDIKLNKSFPFSISMQTLPPYFNMNDTYHWHECLEISYVITGKGRYYIGDKVYEMRPGDIIVINNIEPHYLEVYEEEMIQPVIVFNPDFVLSAEKTSLDYDYLSPFLERGTDFNNKIDSCNPLHGLIMQNLSDLEKEYFEKPEGYSLMIKAKLLTLLTLLFRHFRSNIKPDKHKRINIQRLEAALKYVNENICKDISLNDASKVVNLAPQYFSSIFKKTLGTSFCEYVCKARINIALEMLSNTDKKIIQIALESGFNNCANFNLAFKRITGKTPSDIRSDKS